MKIFIMQNGTGSKHREWFISPSAIAGTKICNVTLKEVNHQKD